RAIIPPVKRDGNSYPGDLENGAKDIFEFSAVENPDRIDQLLRQGIPVYFVDHSFGNWCGELTFLRQRFDMEPVIGAEATGPLAGHAHSGICLWQLRSRQMSLFPLSSASPGSPPSYP
ncbi:MAG TPA: hypothetical protein VL486_09005, partial [Verrucomicrobiae bacterium]|nr:hypothetical protein [Verrucomicrobiae bacterium]